jgi:hypothetical protein
MKRAYPISNLYRENLLKWTRALEAEIREDMDRHAVMEAETRAQGRQLERLTDEMCVG